jgi:hypothetical protein
VGHQRGGRHWRLGNYLTYSELVSVQCISVLFTQKRSVLLASSLTRDQLLQLAHHGARARLTELRTEIAAIERAFPELHSARPGRPRRQSSQPSYGSEAQTAATARDQSSPGSTRRVWSAAQRKAAADRMKSYWAKRKASKKK